MKEKCNFFNNYFMKNENEKKVRKQNEKLQY